MNVAAFFVSGNIAGILNLCTVLGGTGRRRNLSFSYTLGVYHYHTGSINNGIGCWNSEIIRASCWGHQLY